MHRIIYLLDRMALNIIGMFKKFFKNKKYRWRIIKNTMFVVLAGFICLAGLTLLWVVTLKIPDLQSFDQRLTSQSTKIYDSTGNVLLYDLSQEVRRTVVPFDKISQNLKNATISIEDKDFYKHNGVSIEGTMRAILADIATMDFSQGGSTITQQVVKNSLLTTDKTPTRKLKEWILAIKLEKQLDKDSILNLYLNNNPYGGTIYGAEEASQAYFAKKASDLSVGESAYLAAMANAPTYYSPYGKNRDALETRKNTVIKKMYEYGYLSEAEYQAATAEQVKFQSQVSNAIKAPHFVMYVKQYLEDKYGDEMLTRGGLKVITTLDYPLQQKAEELAKTYAEQNTKDFKAKNIALTAVDPTNGQIRVMVGSRDYFDKEIEGNFNVSTAHRQPGSAFKPIVYAEAFKKGYTPDTVVFDLKTQFSTSCDAFGNPLSARATCYMPDNYDEQFVGPISLRNALAQSRNIPAIKALYLAGLKDSISLAKNMGINSLGNPNQYGLTLVLGGGEVSLLELTTAYGSFANGGSFNPSTAIVRIEDQQGNTIQQFATSSVAVLPQQVAYQINDVLSDNVARTPAFGATSPLHFPGRDVAVKTGTTNDYKDAWIIGYTPHLVVGAWAGNNDNTSMAKQVSRYIIAPFWNAVMKEALKELPVETFATPEPIDPNTKPVLRGVWQGYDSFNNANIHSILHWVNTNDPTGAPPSNPYSDPQYTLWETPIQAWLQKQLQTGTNPAPPPNASSTPTTLTLPITVQ